MICDRCKREVDPWPLERSDVCAPKNWGVCIRQLRDVIRTTKTKADHKRASRAYQDRKPHHPLADEPGGDNWAERAYFGEL